MKLSKRGLNLIKEFEDCKLRAYLDAVQVLTIGYGHTKGVKRGQVITQAEADRLLAEDVAEFENGVNEAVKVPLTQNQFDALVSFSFNVGLGNLKRSTLLRRVNAKQFISAANEFAKWNRAGNKVLRGLTRRRAAEARLFAEESLPALTITEIARVDAPEEESETPSSETSVSVQDGNVEVTTSEGPKPPEMVAIEKPPAKGFIKKIQGEIGVLTGGNITVQAAVDQAQQVKLLGLSAQFWFIAGGIVLLATVFYLIVRYFKHRSEEGRDQDITNQLVLANTSPNTKVVLADKEEIDAYRERGYKIIYR
jgi:lysozyme